jgi:hypothetical protein
MSVKGGGCLEKKMKILNFLHDQQDRQVEQEKKNNQFSKIALIPKHKLPEKIDCHAKKRFLGLVVIFCQVKTIL